MIFVCLFDRLRGAEGKRALEKIKRDEKFAMAQTKYMDKAKKKKVAEIILTTTMCAIIHGILAIFDHAYYIDIDHESLTLTILIGLDEANELASEQARALSLSFSRTIAISLILLCK